MPDMKTTTPPKRKKVLKQNTSSEVDILERCTELLQTITQQECEIVARQVHHCDKFLIRKHRKPSHVVVTSQNDELCHQILRDSLGPEIMKIPREHSGRCLYSSLMHHTKCRDEIKVQSFKEKAVKILSAEIDALFPTHSKSNSIQCTKQILFEEEGERFLEVELRCVLAFTHRTIIVANWNHM